jgi:hypothetical protein
MVDVPPLRKLRHLPVAASRDDQAPSKWSARHGIVAASLIVAVISALWALWSRWSEPRIPPFDAANQLRFVDQRLEELTPAQAWQQWIEWFRPLAERGLSELQHPQQAEVDRHVSQARILQRMLLVIAGLFVAVALVAVLWPGPRAVETRGQGDKETRRHR